MTLRARLILLCITASCALFSVSSAVEVNPEYHKTVILFKILQFVTFPDNEDETIRITVYGDDSMARTIRRLAPSYLISGKRITVTQVNSLEQLGAMGKTDLIFLSGKEEKALARILHMVKEQKILRIGSGAGLAEKGVHINIITERNKVSFEINRSEVEKTGIYLSSKLYKLARIVE